jgi:hypothetical protein
MATEDGAFALLRDEIEAEIGEGEVTSAHLKKLKHCKLPGV